MATQKTAKKGKTTRKTASKAPLAERQPKRAGRKAAGRSSAKPAVAEVSTPPAPVPPEAAEASIEALAVEELSSEEQLINIGREKGYVTYEDILSFFPDAEKNIEQLEELFSALSDAGISVVASEDEAADQLIDD